ncbi:MAG: radical SAM protein [Defluviitaleaceae bacterium]|nr:radical SAM protein [Defluviitaleaceae bacterium]
MINKKRKDGNYVVMDVFDRNYAVNSCETLAIKEMKGKSKVFDSYDKYNEYINSIDFFKTVYYNITYRCSLLCPYCYAPKNGSSISLEDNKIIAKRLVELNVQEVVLIGGEPFNHPHLSDIIEGLLDEGLKDISIITNGTIENESVYKLIEEHDIYAQISLDGHNEETNAPTRGVGSFLKVMNKIEKLEELGANFSVMNTLTSENLLNARNFIDFFEERDIRYGFFVVKKADLSLRPKKEDLRELRNYVMEKGYTAVDALDCVKESEQMMFSETGFPITHCGAGITTFTITPDADVFPCLKMLDDNGKLIGNLLHDDWQKQIKDFRKKTLQNDLVDCLDLCKTCDIKYICGGGCRADQTFIENKGISYSQCELQKSNLQYFLEGVK